MSENQYRNAQTQVHSNMVVPVAGTGPARGIGDVSLAFVTTPLPPHCLDLDLDALDLDANRRKDNSVTMQPQSSQTRHDWRCQLTICHCSTATNHC